MSSKLTLHCQGIPGWANEFLARGNSRYIKFIGNYPTYPGVVTIGRPYYEQGQVDDLVRAGVGGADAIFAAVRTEVESNPQVGIWETPANEASIWDASVLANYVSFNQRLIQRFHGIGKKIIVGAINTGWPKLPQDDGGAMMNVVARACQGADGISFHEYAANDLRVGAGYNTLRYRWFHNYCVQNGYAHPPVYITECGIDRPDGGPCFGHSGWVQVLNGNVDAYVEQLIWYEKELRRDSYIECATIFTAAPSGWWCFEVTENLAMKLADALAAIAPEPPGGKMEVKYFKVVDGGLVQSTLEQLKLDYGPVTVVPYGDSPYGTVELYEKKNCEATLIVTCLDKNRQPLADRRIDFGWPDGTVTGFTDSTGAVGFGMGVGAYYRPPGEKGPHYIIAGNARVEGLGMKVGTNHDHVNVTAVEGTSEQLPPLDQRAKGFFVSEYQGTLTEDDWHAIRAAGYSYVHIRSSSGLHVDPTFAANFDNAGKAGVLRSVWHYLTNGDQGQAGIFHNTVGDRVPELGFYGDFEAADLTVAKCESFLAALDNNFGIHAGVYTSAGWLNPRGSPSWGDRPLWVAHWTSAENPVLPNPWVTYEFWQYAGGAYDPAVDANVCQDRYRDTQAVLYSKYGEPLPPEEYTLTVVVYGNGHVEPGTVTVAKGTVVIETAVPDDGWDFAEWGGQASGNINPLSLTIDQSLTITAEFIGEAPPIDIEKAIASIMDAISSLNDAIEALGG